MDSSCLQLFRRVWTYLGRRPQVGQAGQQSLKDRSTRGVWGYSGGLSQEQGGHRWARPGGDPGSALCP